MEQEKTENRKKLNNAKWYALRVISGKEKRALENLEFELGATGLDKYVTELLLPKEREFKLKSGKKIAQDKLSFPGYLLLGAELNGELKRIVEKTNFIIDFIGTKGIPTPMREKEVERIIGKMETEEEDIAIPFLVGEIVEIIDGPFSTFKGEVTELNQEKESLKVNVSIFGRVSSVDLNYLQVNKD